MQKTHSFLKFLTQNNKIQSLKLFNKKQVYQFCVFESSEKQFISKEELEIQENKEKYQQQLKIIQASLIHVNKLGWNDKAIGQGCLDLNISSASNRLITPYEVIVYQMKNWNKEAIKELEEEIQQGKVKGVKNIIYRGIQLRLQQQIPYISRWNEAMAVGALPVNAKQTFDLLWNYADDVWFLAGDRSLDYNHYTKRSLFLAAYTSTELHFLTDQSGTYEPTWQFLERRLNDILYFGGKAGQLLNMASASLNGVQQIASLLVPGRKPIRNPEQDINNIKQQQNKQRKEQSESKYNE